MTDNTGNPYPESTRLGSSERRRAALLDILYLMSLIWLYLMAFIVPLAGIVTGIVFSSAAGTEETKRIGRICLILGIISIFLYFLFIMVIISVGGLLLQLPFSSGEGL